MKKLIYIILFSIFFLFFSILNSYTDIIKIPILSKISQPTIKSQFINSNILVFQQDLNHLLIIKNQKIKLLNIKNLQVNFIDFILSSENILAISATPDKNKLQELKKKYKKIITNILYILNYKGEILMEIPSLSYADTTKDISISPNNKFLIWITDNFVSTKINFINLQNLTWQNLKNKNLKELKIKKCYINSYKEKLFYNDKYIILLDENNNIVFNIKSDSKIKFIDYIKNFKQILITTENYIKMINKNGTEILKIENKFILPDIYGFFKRSYLIKEYKIITLLNNNIYYINIIKTDKKEKIFKKIIAKNVKILDLNKLKNYILYKKNDEIILKKIKSNKIIFKKILKTKNIIGKICPQNRCITLIKGIFGFNAEIDILNY